MTNTTDDATEQPDPDQPEQPDPDQPDQQLGQAGRPLCGPRIDRLLVVVTAIAVVVGVVLRFMPRSGLWLDEALSVNIANLPIGDIPSALRRDGHPPLFYVLLHVWNSIGGDSDWWVRAMSGVASVAMLPLAYLAGRRIGERGAGLGARRTGLIALAVAAVMPFGIRYGAEARMYALVMLFATGGYLLVDDLLGARRTGRGRVAATVGAALVSAALLWTHYWSMWLLAAVGIVALWRAWREPDPERRLGARLLIGALVAGGIAFLPWVSALLYQSARTGTPWGDSFGPASVVVLTIVDFAGARFGVAHLMTYLLVPLILLAAVASIQRSRPQSPGSGQVGDAGEFQQVVLTTRLVPRVRTEVVVIALTLSIGWATAFFSGNTFSSRYTSGIYPLFLLCIAAGVAVLRRPAVTAVVLATVVAMSIFGGIGIVRSDRSQNGDLAQAILDDAVASSGPAVVLSCPDQLGVSLQRELEHRNAAALADGADEVPVGVVIPYPGGGDPDFIDWVDYGDRNRTATPQAFLDQIASRLPADATIYLVASTEYRTFEGQCEQLIGLLATDREVSQTISADDSGLDEFAGLWTFRPRP